MRAVTTNRPPERRSCASIVLINDNTALLFGGVGSSSCFNDVHLYDIAKSEWCFCRVSGTAPSPRGGCAMITMENRFVLMFGGRNEAGELCSDAFLLDCDEMHWNHVNPLGVLPPPREDAVVAFAKGDGVLTDDRVYLFGGCGENGALGDLWCFFVKRMQWTQVAATTTHFPCGLAAAAFAQSGNETFLFGGYDRQGEFHDELYCFQFATECWRSIEVKKEVPCRRTHASMVLVDGILVLYGGYGSQGALGDVCLLRSGGSALSASSCLVAIGEAKSDLHCGLGAHLQRGAACSFASQRLWFVFGGCDGAAFLSDMICFSLNDLVATPRVESLVRMQPQSSSVAAIAPYLPSGTITLSHTSPLRTARPHTPTNTLEASQQGETQQEDGLSSAIAALKRTLFGERAERIDTLVDENKKLREENARLQEIVIDLQAKLENRGHPYGSAMDTRLH